MSFEDKGPREHFILLKTNELLFIFVYSSQFMLYSPFVYFVCPEGSSVTFTILQTVIKPFVTPSIALVAILFDSQR